MVVNVAVGGWKADEQQSPHLLSFLRYWKRKQLVVHLSIQGRNAGEGGKAGCPQGQGERKRKASAGRYRDRRQRNLSGTDLASLDVSCDKYVPENGMRLVASPHTPVN